jgi:hypothetical protein
MSSTAASPRSRSTVCWVGAAEPIALRALFSALLTEAVDVLLLGGQNIMSVNPDRFRQRIGMVFQHLGYL